MSKHPENVERYFERRTSTVYIDRCTKIESFQEYLNHRYRDNCYYYSAYALMGLKPDDFLVRGYIDVGSWRKYHHGWVEFTYKNNEYVFDSMVKTIVSKQDWYEHFDPSVNYKKTQKEILDAFLNEKNAYKVHDGFWQFKYLVMNTEKNLSYREMMDYDRDNGHVPSALMLARLVRSRFSSEVLRFIAYSEPSG